MIVRRISDFCSTGTGGTPSREQHDQYYKDGSIPWVKSGELRESFIYDTEEHLTKVAIRETNIKIVPAGALLMAMYGATVGRLALLSVPATTNQAVCHIIPDQNIAEVRYLFHTLRAKVPYLLNRRVGGAQPNISQGIIKDLEIPLPPLDEQKRIAAILDVAEALREKRRQAIAKLDALVQAVFLEMFGDVLQSEKRIPLGELVKEFRYGTSNKSADDGIPALRIPNILGGIINLRDLKLVPVSDAEEKRLLLQPGDMLFVRTNGNPDYVGRCAVFDPETIEQEGFDSTRFIYASYLIRARLIRDGILPSVLQHYLTTDEGRRELRTRCKTSAGQFNINTEGLGSIPIPEFEYSRQKEYAEQVSQITRMKCIQQQSLAHLDTLFTSLQQRAFKGEL